MYHSITFGADVESGMNTWDDWHLVPTSRPVFNPPPVKTSIIEIPGGDGVLDLTTALAGRPTFSNRTGSIEFKVVSELSEGGRNWAELYSEVMRYLHGQAMRAVLVDDDPEYFYEGRFSVNTWKSDPNYSKITIDYNVNPYKKAINDDDWLWDPFNFEKGIIREYSNKEVNGSLDVIVLGDYYAVNLYITSSVAGITVTLGSITHTLQKGENRFDDFVLVEGENVFKFKGNGTVGIHFDRGRL